MPARARLVLVHGTRLNAAQWTGYDELLGPDIELATPDLPGHGTRMGEPFTLAGAAEVVAASTSPQLPTVVGGHSLGGYVAATVAQTHPHACAGLVLIGAAGDPRSRLATAYRLLDRGVRRAGATRADGLSNAVLRHIVPSRTCSALEAGGLTWVPAATAWPEVMSRCGPDQLDDVTCPVLILGGGLDQLQVHAGRYAAHCRDARIVTVPRASHFLPLTQPERTAKILRGFVEEVAAAG